MGAVLRACPTAQLFTPCPVLGASTGKGDAYGINNGMDQREKLVHRYGILWRRLSPVLTDVSGTDSNRTCRPGCLSPARDSILCYCFPIILLIFPVTVVLGETAAFQKDMIKLKPEKTSKKPQRTE